MNEQGESTVVTGSPVTSAGGPRRGEVIGERYEVQERLGRDAFTLDYRAFDQETETSVLLRLVPPELIDLDQARAAARRLSRIVGSGGRYLSPLLDADHEGPLLYVVEPLPTGTSLREVIQARVARGERIEPVEALPVAARLATALEAVPPPWRHGDVRAERVYIDPENLQLGCPFLLTVLPTDVVRGVLEADKRLGRLFAPEVREGTAGDAADRFGAACVLFEALTGRVPEPGAASASELGTVGERLRELLRDDASTRAGSLSGLIAALAEEASMPVPDLDPGAFRRPKRLSLHRKSETALPAVSDGESLPSKDTEPQIPGAASATGPDAADAVDAVEAEVDAAEPDTAPHQSPAEVSENTRRVVQGEVAGGPEEESRPATEPAPPPTSPVAPQTAPMPAPLPPAPAATPPRAAATPPRAAAMPPRAAAMPPAGRGARARRIEGAAADGTQELDADQVLEAKQIASADGTQELDADQVLEAKRIAGAAPDGTQELDAAQVLEARRVPGAAPEGTQELDASAILEEQPLSGASPAPADQSTPDLDPRLVRAALGIELEGGDAAPARNPTLELGPGDLELVEEAAKKLPSIRQPVQGSVGATRPRRATPAGVVQLPRGIKPIPRPRPDSTPPHARTSAPAPTPALFDDSRVAGPPRAAPPPRAAAPAPRPVAPAPAPAPVVHAPAQVHAPMHAEKTAAGHELPRPALPRRTHTGRWILLIAAIVGVLIIAAGAIIASQRRHNAERERRLQERFHQLQSPEGN